MSEELLSIEINSCAKLHKIKRLLKKAGRECSYDEFYDYWSLFGFVRESFILYYRPLKANR